MESATLELDEALFDPAWWRAEIPELSLTEEAGVFDKPNGPEREVLAGARERMKTDGYFQSADARLGDWASRLAAGVERLHARGLPPPFVFLFDEAWAAFAQIDAQIAEILGPRYQVLPDFWSWRIDTDPKDHGWAPHRDRGYRSLGVGGAPLALTVWIPLTAATPTNSCMYVLPAGLDPVYGTPGDSQYDVKLADIRALPAAPGDYLVWNQAVLHWGSRSSRLGDGPRLSMALEFQRGDASPFNTPLLPARIRPGFEERMRLVAKQILQYRHMYPLTPELERLAQAIERRWGRIGPPLGG
jgi:hypothetical protein